jgi:tryptophanyl-tRNA synthetase
MLPSSLTACVLSPLAEDQETHVELISTLSARMRQFACCNNEDNVLDNRRGPSGLVELPKKRSLL